MSRKAVAIHTRFHQGLEAGHHQLDGTTAQQGLFTEQAGLSLFVKVGLDDAGMAAAVGHGIGQRDVAGRARLSCRPGPGAARGLRCDHDHAEVGARHDLAVVHVEAVGEGQRSALLGFRLVVVLVDLGS